MKQKIKTINNKRLVKADNPSELGKDELLVEVDNTTGKISLFEKDATGKVNQVAGGGSEDGPLPGAVEAGLKDELYIYNDNQDLISNISGDPDSTIDLSTIKDGSTIVFDVEETYNSRTILACDRFASLDIMRQCYITMKGTYQTVCNSLGMVFSSETADADSDIIIDIEIRTPIKKHTLKAKLKNSDVAFTLSRGITIDKTN